MHNNGATKCKNVALLPLYDTASAVLPVYDGRDEVAQELGGLRAEIADGFLYSHGRANANTSRLLEIASFLYGLVELLAEKGLITISDLDEYKERVAERVKERFLTKGMGVHMQEPERDKYQLEGSAEVDCDNRVHLCKAACCRLWFPLSKQDVQEGIVQWDLRYPYIIDQDEDCYCKHLDRGSCGCTVYQHRPIPCRTFDCRQDTRIWLNFDDKVVNPDLDHLFQEGLPHEQGESP